MTRDDAIKIFNTVLCLGKCDCSKDEIEECLKMAIEALKQQPNEDWNAVLDELNRIGRNAFKDDTDYDNLFNFISNLPNVKPQSKTDILDKIRAEIQRLRGCSCSCSDGIIDDVEDILDKYKAESEE